MARITVRERSECGPSPRATRYRLFQVLCILADVVSGLPGEESEAHALVLLEARDLGWEPLRTLEIQTLAPVDPRRIAKVLLPEENRDPGVGS